MKNEQNESKKQKNYNLKSKAVETLANADKEAPPQYSQEELMRYRKKRIQIPNLVKVLFLKAWFAGAVCYFVLWGLGLYVGNIIDMLFILGMVLGMVTDLLTNNLIRYAEKIPGENDKWLLITRKGILGFLPNLVFSQIIVLCVFFLYNFINVFIFNTPADPGNPFLGVEPILYGLFCMGFDMLFVGIKRLCLSIVNDAKASARSQLGK